MLPHNRSTDNRATDRRRRMVRLATCVAGPAIAPTSAIARFAAAFAARVEAFEGFQALCARSGYAEDAPDCEAIVLLCDDDTFAAWDPDRANVGCLAVYRGPFDTAETTGSDYSRRLMIAVNVDASAVETTRMLANGEPPDRAAAAWATTIGHECIHLAYLIRHGGGRTPHEIHDAEGDVGLDQATTLERTEWDPMAPHDVAEAEPTQQQRVAAVEAVVEATAQTWTTGLIIGLDIPTTWTRPYTSRDDPPPTTEQNDHRRKPVTGSGTRRNARER